MSVHTAHYGFNFEALRGALHLPQHPLQTAAAAWAAPARLRGLERLAIWAERQPMHHRLGSYTLSTWVR